MSQKKEPLQSLRTGLLQRGLSIARAGLRAGTMAMGSQKNWLSQAEFIVQELGQLKGTAMKVGQTLSMYGEHLLPKEVNELLKKLQQASPPLAWPAIEAVLKRELGEGLKDLEIETTSIASASIGQVHLARHRQSGKELAIKIQYPGVADAVGSDIKLIKFILGLSEVLPKGARFDQVFVEIRDMFLQEIDYLFEAKSTERFAQWLASESDYFVPEIQTQYSTSRVLTMSRAAGVRADAPEVQGLSQERRNRLGSLFLKLYLRELLEFRCVQTDPHLGNYLIELLEAPKTDRLTLLDFGAVRDVPDDFLKAYRILIRGGLDRNARMIEKGGLQLGLLVAGDSPQLVQDYIDLCFMLTEPFQGVYDWNNNDLPKRVTTQVTKIATSYRLRAPPRELVFLDRKLGGVFIFLSVLKCQFDARPIVESVLGDLKTD